SRIFHGHSDEGGSSSLLPVRYLQAKADICPYDRNPVRAYRSPGGSALSVWPVGAVGSGKQAASARARSTHWRVSHQKNLIPAEPLHHDPHYPLPRPAGWTADIALSYNHTGHRG